MRSCTWRRSVSSCVSPSPPRMPMPPFCRDKWPQNRVSRGSRCCSCASSICNLPSRVRARWAKMSRISDVRSRILQLKIFSRLRLWAGERSSSKMTVSTSLRRQKRGEFLRLAFADERGGRQAPPFFACRRRRLRRRRWWPVRQVRPVNRGGSAPLRDFEFYADEEDPFGPRVSGLDQCFQFCDNKIAQMAAGERENLPPSL